MRYIIMLGLAFCALTPAVRSATFTDEATFQSQLDGGYYLEDFNALGYGDVTGPTWNGGPVNGYGYTISAVGGHNDTLYSNDGSMSSNWEDDDLLVTFTGSPVTAAGGRFFGVDFFGTYIPAIVTVTLSDGTEVSYNPTDIASSFTGFTTTAPINTIKIASVNGTGGGSSWPSMDDFYVGKAAATGIPEPCTLALLGVGAGIAAVRRRRS